jgi:hypothetical protein
VNRQAIDSMVICDYIMNYVFFVPEIYYYTYLHV